MHKLPFTLYVLQNSTGLKMPPGSRCSRTSLGRGSRPRQWALIRAESIKPECRFSIRERTESRMPAGPRYQRGAAKPAQHAPAFRLNMHKTLTIPVTLLLLMREPRSIMIAMSELKTTVDLNGYAFVQGAFNQTDAGALAASLGSPLVPWDGGLVQQITPRKTSTPNTYSGIYGVGRFPFHSDLAHWSEPPRYLLLRCVKGYADVPTLLVDGRMLAEAVSLDILTRAIFRPRRPRVGVLPLLRLCDPTDDGHRIRWDEVFLKPASKIGQIAHAAVHAWLAECQPLRCCLHQAGDVLLIDNWRMLHARAPIPPDRYDRNIERVYLRSLH